MFALPFLGAIAKSSNRPKCQMKSWHNCKDVTTYEEFRKVQHWKHDTMAHVPVGGCKVWDSYDNINGQSSGRACKQADGSWRMD